MTVLGRTYLKEKNEQLKDLELVCRYHHDYLFLSKKIIHLSNFNIIYSSNLDDYNEQPN